MKSIINYADRLNLATTIEECRDIASDAISKSSEDEIKAIGGISEYYDTVITIFVMAINKSLSFAKSIDKTSSDFYLLVDENVANVDSIFRNCIGNLDDNNKLDDFSEFCSYLENLLTYIIMGYNKHLYPKASTVDVVLSLGLWDRDDNLRNYMMNFIKSKESINLDLFTQKYGIQIPYMYAMVNEVKNVIRWSLHNKASYSKEENRFPQNDGSYVNTMIIWLKQYLSVIRNGELLDIMNITENSSHFEDPDWDWEKEMEEEQKKNIGKYVVIELEYKPICFNDLLPHIEYVEDDRYSFYNIPANAGKIDIKPDLYCSLPLIPSVLKKDVSTKKYAAFVTEVFKQDNKLSEKNKELKRIQKERENLISYHAHSWKHISFPSIVREVAQNLLNQGDKENANKLFRAYNSENLLTNDLNLLKIMYSASNEKLMNEFRNSFLDYDSDPYVKKLKNVLFEALDIVVFRVVMENVDTRSDISEIKTTLEDRMAELRESYIQNVFFDLEHYERLMIKEWFNNHIYPLTINDNESDLWDYLKLSTKGNNTAYIIFSDIFINIFTNVMKYSEKSMEKGYLDISVDDVIINNMDYLEFKFSNPIDKSCSIQQGNQTGINSIRNYLEKINSACENGNQQLDPVQVVINDDIYTIKIYICEDAVLTL